MSEKFLANFPLHSYNRRIRYFEHFIIVIIEDKDFIYILTDLSKGA
jgi:hypothetical protein